MPEIELLDLSHLRIDQQADGGGERRALGRLRQPGDAERPSEAHVAPENATRHFDHAGELARSPGVVKTFLAPDSRFRVAPTFTRISPSNRKGIAATVRPVSKRGWFMV